MEERLEYLIHSKGWKELTDEERIFVTSEIGSEEQYEALRNIGTRLAAMPKTEISPAPVVLKLLREKIRNQHQHANVFVSVLSFRMPAYIVVGLLLAAVLLTLATRARVMPAGISSNVIVKTDTLFIHQPTDTVYVTKFVYRYIKPPVEQKTFSVVRQQPEAVGVNMKEKEELENLLVSGSY